MLYQGVGRVALQACIRRQCRYLHAEARPSPPSKNRVVAASTIIVFSVGLGVYLVSSRRALTSSTLPLSPYHFTPVTVESSEANPLDSTTKVITVRIPPSVLPESSFLRPVHSVYIKDDDIQVERPYTPLFGIELEGEAAGRATFWIKRYPQGEVGRWLHSKRAGDVLEIRGPVSTWDYVKEMQNGNKDEIIMISGGTGITPFFQLLQKRFGPSSEVPSLLETAHFTLVHGSPNISTLPPSFMMSYLDGIAEKHRDSFTMKLFLERPHDGGQPEARKEFALGRITKKIIEDILIERGILQPAVESSSWLSLPDWHTRSRRQAEPSPNFKNVLFLVCGPELMVEAIAGPRPKRRADLVRLGILGELGYKASNIRRL